MNIQRVSEWTGPKTIIIIKKQTCKTIVSVPSSAPVRSRPLPDRNHIQCFFQADTCTTRRVRNNPPVLFQTIQILFAGINRQCTHSEITAVCSHRNGESRHFWSGSTVIREYSSPRTFSILFPNMTEWVLSQCRQLFIFRHGRNHSGEWVAKPPNE